MNITKETAKRIVARAQKAWGLQDWTIEVQFGTCEYEGDIEMRFSEKSALITLDKKKITDRVNLVRTVYHEVGHCALLPIERGVSDFVDTYIKDKKARDVFYEQLNTRENEVLDFLITRVFNL